MAEAINLDTLSDDAKALAGVWFGLMKVDGMGTLTLHLIENKPTARTQAALDELLAAKVISVEPFNKAGGLVYRPLVNCHPAYQWQGRLFLEGKGDHINWVLMEPVNG